MTHICSDNSVRLSLPEDVNFIIDTITKAGYEAFAVGGCIRDMLLNRTPDDYDITTSASCETVKSLFKRCLDTGIKHGTVTVMLKEKGYEVTTYRVDGIYEDCRHPKDVTFTNDLSEDLKRRDFTINAMAYNEEIGLVDLFEGRKDIEKKIIRCVGNPYERFNEDALRMLRAVRFSAQLGYEIDEETKKAVSSLAGNISKISEERIQVELLKMVTSDHPEKIRDAYELGLTGVFFPEFDKMMETSQYNPHHCYSVGEHTIKSMENVPKDKYLRLGMLFHDTGKPKVIKRGEDGYDHFHGHPSESEKIAEKVLKRLKFDNETIKTVSDLAFYHDYNVPGTPKGVRRALRIMGPEMFRMILDVKRADILAQSDYKRQEKLDAVKKLEELFNEILKNHECFSLKDLNITGNDLMVLGYPKGPKIGKELNRLLDRVLEDPSLNDKEILLKLSREDMQ